jgi:flavin reductase (DIM6/NTAB) family NADH-FMN oxidoreductase RutF
MKKELGPKNLYYPTLTILAGTTVNGKANFETIAWGGIMGMKNIYIASSRTHYSNRGIHENKTFSINIPSIEQVKITDYCGLHSGNKTDKSQLFDIFYGKLGNVPMISECPVNMECSLFNTFLVDDHEIFIGTIVQTYCDEKYMTDGIIDLTKVQPFLFSFIDSTYWALGKPFAKAMNIGKKL